MADPAPSEFILGGQKSGKSQRAETLAQQWLDLSAANKAVMIATALPVDEEMRTRIQRHREDRATRVPAMLTREEPLQLPDVLRQLGAPDTLLVVDCLTLWLTNLLMPSSGRGLSTAQAERAIDSLLQALMQAPGPVVLVSNEIGLGVIPLGREVRAFVDALGRLNQAVAGVCDQVTLMAAGLPLQMKAPA